MFPTARVPTSNLDVSSCQQGLFHSKKQDRTHEAPVCLHFKKLSLIVFPAGKSFAMTSLPGQPWPPTKNQRTFLPQTALIVLQLHITTTFDNQQLQHLLNLPKQDNEGSISSIINLQDLQTSCYILDLALIPPYPGCNLLQVDSICEPFSGWLTRE